MADFSTRYNVPVSTQEAFKKMLKENKFVVDEKRYAKIQPKINQELKAYLAQQKWQTDGFYYILNQDDKVVEKALEVIRK
jgi:predicted nucleotidyltransferase